MSCQRDAGPHLLGALGWNLVHVSVGERRCSCSIINSRITESGSTDLFSYFFFFSIVSRATKKKKKKILIQSFVHLLYFSVTPCSATLRTNGPELCCSNQPDALRTLANPTIPESSKHEGRSCIDRREGHNGSWRKREMSHIISSSIASVCLWESVSITWWSPFMHQHILGLSPH